jgi:hypothetical protein
VQPRDCQAVEAEADGAADEEEATVEVLVAVDAVELFGVVVGAAVDADVAVADEDEEAADDAGMRASFWKMLILYPPPHTVFWPFGSPLHLTLHPSVAGTKLTAEAGEHQHS